MTPQLVKILLPPKLVGIRAFLRYPHSNTGVNDRVRLVATFIDVVSDNWKKRLKPEQVQNKSLIIITIYNIQSLVIMIYTT